MPAARQINVHSIFLQNLNFTPSTMSTFALNNLSLQLREPESDDDAILFEIYLTSHGGELVAAINLPETQKKQLLELQFRAQEMSYRKNYPGADFWMIETEGKAIGFVYLETMSHAVRIINLGLLKEFRSQGIGSDVLQDIISFANSNCLSVILQVQNSNPAFNLYKRMGFKVIDDTNGIHYLMEYKRSKIIPT